MQELLFQDAQTVKKATERAAVVRAWCDLNEEVRKLSMRPLPKSVDLSKLPKRGSRARVSSEPTEPK